MLHILNIVGFLFAFIGTLIVFQFGIPNQIDTGGKESFMLLGKNEKEIEKIAKYKKLSRIGFYLP